MHSYLGLKHKLKRTKPEDVKKNERRPYVRFLDKVTLVAGIIGPFTVLPQVIEIFSSRDATGVSLTTWVLITIVTLPWVFYGFAHRDRSIVISFILWEVVNMLVVIGVLLYG